MKTYRTVTTVIWAAIFFALTLHAYADKEMSPTHLALAQSTCEEAMHLKQGIVPFDACVQSLTATMRARTKDTIVAAPRIAASMRREIGSDPTYGGSSREERRPREEHACLDIGLTSGSVDFSQCVARLDAALSNEEASNSP